MRFHAPGSRKRKSRLRPNGCSAWLHGVKEVPESTDRNAKVQANAVLDQQAAAWYLRFIAHPRYSGGGERAWARFPGGQRNPPTERWNSANMGLAHLQCEPCSDIEGRGNPRVQRPPRCPGGTDLTR